MWFDDLWAQSQRPSQIPNKRTSPGRTSRFFLKKNRRVINRLTIRLGSRKLILARVHIKNRRVINRRESNSSLGSLFKKGCSAKRTSSWRTSSTTHAVSYATKRMKPATISSSPAPPLLTSGLHLGWTRKGAVWLGYGLFLVRQRCQTNILLSTSSWCDDSYGSNGTTSFSMVCRLPSRGSGLYAKRTRGCGVNGGVWWIVS